MSESRSSTFYGWYVLAATSLILFISSGVRLTIGVMMKPVTAEFGWSRSAVSLTVFSNMVVFAVSVIIVGKLYDRYGPKWVILVSSVLFSAGYMLMAVMTSFWQFFFLYGFLAAAGTGGTTLSIFAALLSKWFEKRRGLAISLGLSGGCFGQFAIVPLFTHMVLAYGWRFSNLCIGLVSLIVNVVLVLLVIKGDPDDLGVEPHGRNTAGDPESSGLQVPEPSGVRDLRLGEAMRTRSLWLFAFFMFVCGSGDFLVTTHLIALVTDHGISATTGGNMLAWFGLLSLGGILVAGPASDLIGNRIPIALTFALRVVLFLLILKYQGVMSFYFFSLGFGFSFLVTAPLSATLAGRLYGFSHVGAIAGFVHTVHHVGGGLWAYLGGVIFDQTGSYDLAFAISAVMALMAVVSTLLIKETKHATQ